MTFSVYVNIKNYLDPRACFSPFFSYSLSMDFAPGQGVHIEVIVKGFPQPTGLLHIVQVIALT